jgi:hypothetical protein
MRGDGMLIEWEDALEMNVARTGTVAYRTKCAESHPNHEHWRKEMIRMATDTKTYPPITAQIGNALNAAGRAIAAVATGQPVLVPDSVYGEREAVCETNTCGKYDAAQHRCIICGCRTKAKLRGAQEECALVMIGEKPLWTKYNPS